tara:strand:- start:584 stop:1357 length:774 start_codon:yes stop_codon:yes gene_type:complete
MDSDKEEAFELQGFIRTKLNDQDFMQKVNVSSTLLFEIYRVLMGAFLIAFIPQECNDHICSVNENINRSDALSITGNAFNLFTFISFLFLYSIEVKRENKLITYLEVNKTTASDNDSVGEALEKLEKNKKEAIWNLDKYYQNCGYVSSVSFLINTVLSIIVISNHYLDSKTITVLLTNVLFMALKVSDVFATVNTKKNIFFSAYLKKKVQFNDVDPDKFKTHENTLDEIVSEENVAGEPLESLELLEDNEGEGKLDV